MAGAAVAFGRLADGSEVQEVAIGAGDLAAKVISFGAVVRDVRLAGVDHPLVLGFDDVDSYVHHSPHCGAVVGRFANRIGDGRFAIDGKVYQLALNERGHTHLHGGPNGFASLPWRLVDHDDASVTLALTSANGDEGYPGRLEVTCRYVIEAPATLRFEAEATTDAPTIVNLAQHTYFNLDDSPEILDHDVRIFADAYTPVDEWLVPTGAVVPVAGTPYDFGRMRSLRRIVDGKRFPYDVNMVVSMDKAAAPRPVASLRSPSGSVALDVHSTEPGVQFYDGNSMNITVPGLGGRRYGVSSGVCFEPQLFPDAPNHPNFPSALLRPGETYRQTTVYTFARG
jgi:aldose 1-epimerase